MKSLSFHDHNELNLLRKQLGRDVSMSELQDHLTRQRMASEERYRLKVVEGTANLPVHYERMADQVQELAISLLVWRGRDTDLVDLIAKDASTEERGRLIEAVKNQNFQRLLHTEREVGLWRGADRLYRLVDQQPVTDPAMAKQILASRTSPGECRYCRLRENNPDAELIYERNLRGNVVAGVRLHPMCVRPWQRLRAFAGRFD